MTLVPGSTIGPYRILEQIGRGGMATVYKAYQASLARHVAVKVLPEFFAQEPGFRDRFQQEAIAIAKLRHPNILGVYDFGEEAGVTYIASEFVDGGTLTDQLGAPLPVDYVVKILGPVGSALDYAHARGVLHRDIKPSNILLARDGTPVLSDFGLARMMGSLPRLTTTGTAVGTPEYMAPEQGAGEEVGPAADLYALAVVAYEMLTGRVPFSAETPLAVLLAHMHKPLPLPRSVNPNLGAAVEEVLLKGLAKRPEDRFRTAGELVGALSDAARGVTVARAPVAAAAMPAAPVAAPAIGVTPSPTPPPAAATDATTQVSLPAKRRGLPRWAIAGGVVLGVLLLAGVAAALSRSRPAATPATTPGATAVSQPTPAKTAPGPTAAPTLAAGRIEVGAPVPRGQLIADVTFDSDADIRARVSNPEGSGEVTLRDGALVLSTRRNNTITTAVLSQGFPPPPVVMDLQFVAEANVSLWWNAATQQATLTVRIVPSRDEVEVSVSRPSGSGRLGQVKVPNLAGREHIVSVIATAQGTALGVDGRIVALLPEYPLTAPAAMSLQIHDGAGSARVSGLRLYRTP